VSAPLNIDKYVEYPDLPDAACKGVEYADVFFPPRGAGNAIVTAQALNLCRHCIERVPCLTWAYAHHPVDGIWGGTTYKQRRKPA
jgi:hypothetical protein